MQNEIIIVYKDRQGRRVNGRYEIRFHVVTSDGREFWSHKNYDEALRQAQAHINGEVS